MDTVTLLRERFGFDGFRPGQREVIEALAEHGRALAVFPTGGGKSICYQLPALAFEGVTVVVSPLIALMKDQIDFLRGRGIAAARLDSTLGQDELRAVNESLERGALRLLYVAPERFQNERFLGLLERTRISLFAIDEAHCISEWGHNFRPDYLKLAQITRAIGAERILTLTATATPSVVRDICAAFDIPDSCAIVTGFYRENLDLKIELTTPAARDALLLQRISERPPGPSIVYVTLQKTAERVATLLSSAGLGADAYHAGLETEQRTAVQDRWMRSDRRIVVATIAFGMGIDKANVRYVYHYNLPKSLESYSQEIGRAGRDGATSIVELLACEDDAPTLENFAYGDTPSEGAIHSLVSELLGRGEAFDVALTDLSDRHDIRILVVRTALTYLELLGVLQQGTPFYAGYRLRLALEPDEVVARFSGEPAAFLGDLFRRAKKGRTWLSVDPEALSAAMNQPRARIVRSLEVLEERGYAELQASDVRQRFTRPASTKASVAELVADLHARFTRREAQEIHRLHQVLELVHRPGCKTNALVAHFGELRTEPCGHCTGCTAPPVAARAAPLRELPAQLDTSAIRAVARAHLPALGEPRQLARFLCGLPSPAVSRARLGRHALFGALAEHRFAQVMELSTRVLS